MELLRKANWPYCEHADHPPPADWLEVALPRSNWLTIPHSPKSAPWRLKPNAVLLGSTLEPEEHDAVTSAAAEIRVKRIFISLDVGDRRVPPPDLFQIPQKNA